MSEPKYLLSRRARCRQLAIAMSLAVASVPTLASPAWAGSAALAARGEALSRQARTLRDGGRVTEACSLFAEAKQVAPGVGVSLDLADCFERLGRTTSAWYEFGSAEKLAREHDDSRAELARTRAQALQGHLSRLTIAVAAETAASAAEILLDKQAVPREMYNVALAVDPGAHVVSVVPKAGPPRRLDVHVEPDAPPLTVQAENARPIAHANVEAPAAKLAPADALFEEGKRLRQDGKIPEACSKFAQSQALAQGIGITLHLGDCYERLGRTASAWTEFSIAEKDAHERKDPREATAHARVAALEPKLQRVTIVVPESTPQDGALLQLDGRTVPPSMWNVAVVTDPGDHLVTFQPLGAERRTFPVHLDASQASLTVRVGEQAGQADSATAGNSAAPAGPPPASASEHAASTRRWVEIGLLGGAVVAAGVGAGLLVVKNDSMSSTGANGNPYVDPVAAAASKIAFATAGAAAATAIVLYLTAPHPKDTGLRVSPAPMVGGGGVLLGGTF